LLPRAYFHVPSALYTLLPRLLRAFPTTPPALLFRPTRVAPVPPCFVPHPPRPFRTRGHPLASIPSLHFIALPLSRPCPPGPPASFFAFCVFAPFRASFPASLRLHPPPLACARLARAPHAASSAGPSPLPSPDLCGFRVNVGHATGFLLYPLSPPHNYTTPLVRYVFFSSTFLTFSLVPLSLFPLSRPPRLFHVFPASVEFLIPTPLFARPLLPSVLHVSHFAALRFSFFPCCHRPRRVSCSSNPMRGAFTNATALFLFRGRVPRRFRALRCSLTFLQRPSAIVASCLFPLSAECTGTSGCSVFRCQPTPQPLRPYLRAFLTLLVPFRHVPLQPSCLHCAFLFGLPSRPRRYIFGVVCLAAQRSRRVPDQHARAFLQTFCVSPTGL